jgi:hypothetical protein
MSIRRAATRQAGHCRDESTECLVSELIRRKSIAYLLSLKDASRRHLYRTMTPTGQDNTFSEYPMEHAVLWNCASTTFSKLNARWRSWLRHCATNRKVAVSIPDGVIGIFHWHIPSGRTMAQGLTNPLTEMSARNISWEVTLPSSCIECLKI